MNPSYGVSQVAHSRLEVLRFITETFKPVLVLEIGSYEGQSALNFSKVMKFGEVICVDPWEPYLLPASLNGSEAAKAMQDDLNSGAAFHRFRENIKLANPHVPIYYYVGTIDKVLPGLPHPKFDLVYVDGCHLYEEALKDLIYSAHLVREGGVLCGDDLEYQGEDDPNELWDREWNGQYHPGVTRAVRHFFGRRISARCGIWAVKKIKGNWEDFDGLS